MRHKHSAESVTIVQCHHHLAFNCAIFYLLFLLFDRSMFLLQELELGLK